MLFFRFPLADVLAGILFAGTGRRARSQPPRRGNPDPPSTGEQVT